ncbi:MAG: alpha/beta hydrolase, partial [Woeseiaceae bacterium]
MILFLARMKMTNIYSMFDQAELDREYSPSSCVDDINVFLDDYARLSKIAKQAAVDDGTCTPDLRYGSGAEETLDLFVAKHSGSAPLHVFIHGGYWQLLSKDESCFAAPMFQEAGSYFAALNYSLAPQRSLTGIVAEIRRAIVWLYSTAEKWGFDRNRIFLSGSSAGAHLATMMMLTDWTDYGLPEDTVKGVCAISGVFDLEPVVLTYVNDVVGMDTD